MSDKPRPHNVNVDPHKLSDGSETVPEPNRKKLVLRTKSSVPRCRAGQSVKHSKLNGSQDEARRGRRQRGAATRPRSARGGPAVP
ncbi:hypothetical protein EVAR_24126_1 [Eumeta japonica]|uniref:Uncharacterized protein n=1 Tax=Eumeta variegata TaxID=151549 RepID=A0A4C1YRY1_EUMVA|nr:hypothetical protein EVAR_24126_1 [Eumeta japonica]